MENGECKMTVAGEARVRSPPGRWDLTCSTTAVFQGNDFDQRWPVLFPRRKLRRSRTSAPAGAAVNSQGRKPLDSGRACSQPWKGDTKPERRHSDAAVIRV